LTFNALYSTIRRGVDTYLAFPISYFLFTAQQNNFIGWIKEDRITKSYIGGVQGGICRVNTFL
jgi:hypothetical protein